MSFLRRVSSYGGQVALRATRYLNKVCAEKPGSRPALIFRWMPSSSPGMTSGESGASQHPITLLYLLRIQVEIASHLLELGAHRRHAILDGAAHRHPHTRGIVQRRRIIPHILCDLHRAEFWAAHRAEVGDLVGFLRQGFVVEAFCGVRIEAEVELVGPAEVEAGAAERIVAELGGGVALAEIGGVGGDLVGDDADLDVVTIRETQMLLRRDV